MTLGMKNVDTDFNQNFTAARESSLLSQLNRSKSKIQKLKISLQTYEGTDNKSESVADELLTERAKYYNVLTQLNQVRSQNTKRNIKAERDEAKTTQVVSYYTEEDIYSKSIDNISKMVKKIKFKVNFGESYINSATLNYRTNVVDTVQF